MVTLSSLTIGPGTILTSGLNPRGALELFHAMCRQRSVLLHCVNVVVLRSHLSQEALGSLNLTTWQLHCVNGDAPCSHLSQAALGSLDFPTMQLHCVNVDVPRSHLFQAAHGSPIFPTRQ